jgi:hypothetical protein
MISNSLLESKNFTSKKGWSISLAVVPTVVQHAAMRLPVVVQASERLAKCTR